MFVDPLHARTVEVRPAMLFFLFFLLSVTEIKRVNYGSKPCYWIILIQFKTGLSPSLGPGG